MAFSYDGDDLGYEYGYPETTQKLTPQKLLHAENEIAPTPYHCIATCGDNQKAGTKPGHESFCYAKDDLVELKPQQGYNDKGWKIDASGQQKADEEKPVGDKTYEKWTKKDGSVHYWIKGGNEVNKADLPGGAWPPSGVAGPLPKAPGSPTSSVTPGSTTAEPISIHEYTLRSELTKKGLNKDEVDAYMTRFDTLKPPTTRDKAIQKDLDGVKLKTGDEIRKDMNDRLRDKAVEKFKASKAPNEVTPQMAYDNLVARGIVKEDPPGKNRPSEKATWKDVKDADVKEWTTSNLKGADLKKAYDDPLISKSDFKTNPVDVKKDTERRQYLAGAWDKYKAWATAKPGDPKPPSKEPDTSKGLGLTEAEARKHFDNLTTQLKLTDAEGKPTAFDPEATGKDDPANAFFPIKEGESRFNEDGTLKKDLKFQHESLDPANDDSAVNPVTKVVKENVSKAISRDVLYATMTGQVPPGSKMKIEKKDDKTFLVGKGPDGKEIRQEIKVLDPPVTPAEADAYMQSKRFVDGEGQPLPDATGESMTAESVAIQKGEIGASQIKYKAAAFERKEIVKILAAPPYSMKGPEITRYMNSKGWLGDHPNVDQMESFRKKAAGKKSVEEIKKDVKDADVAGNDPTEQTEKDRAEDIKDVLATSNNGKDNGAKEARAGRETGKEEGAAGRDTSIKVAKIREEGEDKRARDRREFDREEAAKKRDFDAEQAKLSREHDSAEKKLDRENQMMMSLIQFLGQMISGAMSAMAQVEGAAISSTHNLGNERVASMRGGK